MSDVTIVLTLTVEEAARLQRVLTDYLFWTNDHVMRHMAIDLETHRLAVNLPAKAHEARKQVS